VDGMEFESKFCKKTAPENDRALKFR